MMDRRLSSAALYSFCILSSVLWSGANSITECGSQRKCMDCISMDDTCGWCQDEGVRIDDRCRMNGTDDDCDMVFSPPSSIDDKVVTENIVPREAEISLRALDTLPLTIELTTSRNIPLDVYILFDVSQSMTEEIEAIQSVSDDIIDNLAAITDNVQVGVGSYIDKRIFPFSRVDLGTPGRCVEDNEQKFIACYNFRHYGRMTSNRTELRARFAAVETGANIDAPEAGFDAMAQIALCNDLVGWRQDAVKIILYFTDDAFKFAGEGRQAGILTPFDYITCGLESATPEYFLYEGLENDYPSPGQLLQLLADEEIVPVFISVTSDTQAESFYNVTRTHEELANLFNLRLGGRASSANVDTSGDQSTVANNILTIIDRQVLLILQQTGLDPEEMDGIRFTVEAECPPGAMEQNTGTGMESCTNVGVGNLTVFTLNVTLTDCTTFGTAPREINVQVRPLGMVVVRVTPICSCNCGDLEVNSTRCSGNGNYSCGECLCNKGYCGLQCQFNESERTCPLGINNEECSGVRGNCFFCECLCERNLTTIIPDIRPDVTNVSAFGEACECDFFSCLNDDMNATDICTRRGDCCNRQCRCHRDEDGYQYRSMDTELRQDCLCEPAEKTCRAAGTNVSLCSGVGECGCEMCECPVPYTGNYCQTLDLGDCNLATESEVEVCILAEKERSDRERRNNVCATTCSFDELNMVEISCVLIIPSSLLPADDAPDSEEMNEVVRYASEQLDGTEYGYLRSCSFTDNDTCTHDYYIIYNKNDISELVFVADSDRRCPGVSASNALPIPLWALAIILLGLLLILGVVILFIIKMIFLCLDYFEVKRLEKEVGMADFSKNQNPLYQSPDVEYKNVAYGKE